MTDKTRSHRKELGIKVANKFSTATMESKSQWNNGFKILREKSFELYTCVCPNDQGIRRQTTYHYTLTSYIFFLGIEELNFYIKNFTLYILFSMKVLEDTPEQMNEPKDKKTRKCRKQEIQCQREATGLTRRVVKRNQDTSCVEGQGRTGAHRILRDTSTKMKVTGYLIV